MSSKRLLAGSTMLMLQTDTVEGEQDAIADVESGPLWAGLPGVVGEMRLVDDLAAVLGEAP